MKCIIISGLFKILHGYNYADFYMREKKATLANLKLFKTTILLGTLYMGLPCHP